MMNEHFIDFMLGVGVLNSIDYDAAATCSHGNKHLIRTNLDIADLSGGNLGKLFLFRSKFAV